MNNILPWFIRLYLVGLLLFLGTEKPLLAQLGRPEMKMGEATDANEDLDYEYFDLSCDVGVWDGYFAPERWHRTSDEAKDRLLTDLWGKSGDNTFVLFGRERAGVENWSIEIPVAGYLSFRLLPSSARDEIRISINGRSTYYQIRSDGLYYSPFLKAGDRFALHIPAGNSTYRWSDLLFHSNYSAVIVRPDKVRPEEKYQPISNGRIQRVFFPDDEPGTWPVFDQDGDLLTTYDQQELRASGELFEVSYTDKTVTSEEGVFLQRTFTIREKCSRGNWLRRSRKWFPMPLIPDH